MSKKSFVALGIVCVGLSLVASPLSAQEVKASGTNMFVPKVVETFSLAGRFGRESRVLSRLHNG